MDGTETPRLCVPAPDGPPLAGPGAAAPPPALAVPAPAAPGWPTGAAKPRRRGRRSSPERESAARLKSLYPEEFWGQAFPAAPPCGPPAAPPPALPVAASVAKEARLFTPGGCPRLGDLAESGAVAWSGRRWVRVRARALPGPPVPLFRVRLDDGSSLVCSAEHPWAVVADGRIVPVRTGELRTDFAVSPFNLFPPEDVVGVSEAPGAYALGGAYGAKMAGGFRLKDGLPARVFAMDRPSLADFVAGWLDAQKGVVFGCANAMHDLQIVLHRLGVYHTFLEDRGPFHALALSAEDAGAIPNPRGLPREFRRIVSELPRVTEVYALGERRRPYTVEAEKAHTLVLDGVLTLC